MILHKKRQPEILYRAAWARTYLKKYGLLDNPARAVWKINDAYNGEKINRHEVVIAVRNNKVYEQKESVLQSFDIASNNEKLIKQLAKEYHKNNVSLFLGAGVSMAAHMPSWDELIAQFLIRRFQSDLKNKMSDHVLQELVQMEKVNRENSMLSQTRFIKQNMEPEKYIELLMEALYKNIDAVNIHNPLFQSLMRLIWNDNHIFIKNIITLNFDDLIETKLDDKGIVFHQYADTNNKFSKNCIHICHVHGLLAHDAKPDEIHIDDIIFSEEQYHKMYNDPFHWSNMKQVITLRENTCLFIGCSLTDPNMRRLLDIAQNESVFKHYAIMKKEEIKIPLHNDIHAKASRIYKDFYIQNRTSYFKSLGVHIIWVDDYDEIPTVLETIIKS